MLLFNRSRTLLFWVVSKNFNTSNVTIQLSAELLTAARGDNFNTSNVTIQPGVLILGS